MALSNLMHDMLSSTADTDVSFEAAAQVVIMGHFDRYERTVPIFPKFFRNAAGEKQCIICVDDIREIVFTSRDWNRISKEFPGLWMSEISTRVMPEMLSCDHDVEYCKKCLLTHLETKVQALGRNVAGKLDCPQCSRLLSEDEIRRCGSKAIIEE
jgi:Zinc finger, C3HC4 type (RING finger)